MAAKSTKERSAKRAERRRERGEEELRHTLRPGTKAMLEDLMAWHEFEEQAEVIQLLIMNAHALGPGGSAALLAVPRHEITISPSVARKLAEFTAPAAEE